MACSKQMLTQFLLLLLFITRICALNSTTILTPDSKHAVIKSVCKSTPYPDVCFDSLKLSISTTTSINIKTNTITYIHQSVQVALSEAGKLSMLLSNNNNHNTSIVEKHKGTIQDCKELQQITVSSLNKSLSGISLSSQNLADARMFLSAALTNTNTCLEGLESATGPLKPTLVDSMTTTYKHVSNSLSLLSANGGSSKQEAQQHSADNGFKTSSLMALPKWLSRKDRRFFHKSYSFGTRINGYNMLVVAADGTGDFTTITEAINSAPNYSRDRTIIYIRRGVYEECIEVPHCKPNILLFGEGSNVTTIRGNRSMGENWTTYRSATVGVCAEGFLARDISFENTAGPQNLQAVALRINANFAAIYKCVIKGYQDTLYAHTFKQFYRECIIYGTIDYICGSAAAVFQKCKIISRMPMPGQFTVAAAHARETPYEPTGFSFQNCSMLATEDLHSHSSTIESYLGRPWKQYARTVFIHTYIDDFIDRVGWSKWPEDDRVDALYFGEYGNTGPGSLLDSRVNWPGYHIMNYNDAYNFTVSTLLHGKEWLDSTSFPYDPKI